MTTYTFPKYRSSYLTAMTSAEIEAIPDKANCPILIATGAIEQHGRQLPVGVDSLMGQAWLDYALPKLPESIKAYVAPPIVIGKSNEHTGFPGTLILDKSRLRQQLLLITDQLKNWGFRKIGIINTHGGNIQVLEYTCREISANGELQVAILKYSFPMEISKQEAAYGFHANEAETSWILEILDGKCVDMAEAVREYPASIDDPGELKPEAAPAIFSWVTSDLSKSGVMGDSTKGTPEKGKEWMDKGSSALAKAIEALYNY